MRLVFSFLLVSCISLGNSIHVIGNDNIPTALADRIVIHKSSRTLQLIKDNRTIKEYRVALGSDPNGPKEQEGDGKTPEGEYVIDYRNPHSKFHRALHTSYPNDLDKKRAKELGVSPGGDIMIHGIKNGLGWLGSLHRIMDWTNGCIAVTDREIEEIWNLVADGTRLIIKT